MTFSLAVISTDDSMCNIMSSFSQSIKHAARQ